MARQRHVDRSMPDECWGGGGREPRRAWRRGGCGDSSAQHVARHGFLQHACQPRLHACLFQAIDVALGIQMRASYA